MNSRLQSPPWYASTGYSMSEPMRLILFKLTICLFITGSSVNCQFLFNIVAIGFAESVNILFKQIIQAQ